MTIFKQLRLVCLLLLGLAWTTTLSFASVDVQSPTICGVSIGYDQAYASHNGYDAAPLRAWEDENQSALADTRASFGLEPGFIAAKAGGRLADDVIHVSPNGVAFPPGPKYQIPSNYIENANRSGSYGVMQNGKFVEKLRIDAATSPGMKGPNYGHYHLDGGKTHYSPRPGDPDPGFSP